jgi:hypothetical protein
MSLVDDFLNSPADEIDALLGTETMTVAGQSFQVVWNDERLGGEGALGGIEPEIRATATAQPSDVSNPLSLRNARCTVAGRPYRINEVTAGAVAVHFALVDPNESR